MANDINLIELNAGMTVGTDGQVFLQAILDAAVPIPAGLNVTEFIAQLIKGAIKAAGDKNTAEGYVSPDLITAYSSTGLGTVRQDGEGKRYVQETYTITARNYINEELVAQNN